METPCSVLSCLWCCSILSNVGCSRTSSQHLRGICQSSWSAYCDLLGHRERSDFGSYRGGKHGRMEDSSWRTLQDASLVHPGECHHLDKNHGSLMFRFQGERLTFGSCTPLKRHPFEIWTCQRTTILTWWCSPRPKRFHWAEQELWRMPRHLAWSLLLASQSTVFLLLFFLNQSMVQNLFVKWPTFAHAKYRYR